MSKISHFERAPRSRPAAGLAARFQRIRAFSAALAAPLSAEDCGAQSMPDASPVKWHLAHTSWFFETFILARDPSYENFDDAFKELFNSYYNTVGAPFERSRRGMLTRPSLENVMAFRAHVDDAIIDRLAAGRLARDEAALVELGLHHEQQHQELILTDVKHLLSQNPLQPKYCDRWPLKDVNPVDATWIAFDGGVREIGADDDGFHFDNEGPAHSVFLEDFELASLPATNQRYIEFIEDGGYERAEFWLDAGLQLARTEGWTAPLYWRKAENGWRCFTLHGEAPVDPHAPVCHLSFYEADAFARWSGARLPTEAEWEVAARDREISGNFADSGVLHPLALRAPLAPGETGQMFGDVWEWTRSDYAPYPGYQPPEGAVGEYNGKFMSGQYVLKGGSCATPVDHIRATYRNFFPPSARWQFSGVRLARDASASNRRSGGAEPSFITIDRRKESSDAEDLARGLLQEKASISPKYFYDRIGSQLFETITRLPEYYIPDAEKEIMDSRAAEIATAARQALGDGYQIVDLGAGNCEKAEKLLPGFRPTRYVAVDISASYLEDAIARISARFPDIEMVGVGMDFSRRLELPEALRDRPTLAFYPGSSLGNFDAGRSRLLLQGARALADDCAILVGVDLVKDKATLEAAYDDATGVTAAFNLNILRHANRILGADFDPAAWRHVAFFNEAESRIEMRLEAKSNQIVRWPDGERRFAAGERILTEFSRKWRKDEIGAMLKEAGFGEVKIWTDNGERFAVALGIGR